VSVLAQTFVYLHSQKKHCWDNKKVEKEDKSRDWLFDLHLSLTDSISFLIKCSFFLFFNPKFFYCLENHPSNSALPEIVLPLCIKVEYCNFLFGNY
jgi:hypothetical protein